MTKYEPSNHFLHSNFKKITLWNLINPWYNTIKFHNISREIQFRISRKYKNIPPPPSSQRVSNTNNTTLLTISEEMKGTQKKCKYCNFYKRDNLKNRRGKNLSKGIRPRDTDSTTTSDDTIELRRKRRNSQLR